MPNPTSGSTSLSNPDVPEAGYVRRITLSVYLPTLLAEIGIGAILPLLTLSALAFGQSETVASLAVTVYAIGRLVGGALGGVFTTRAGAVPATLLGLLGLAAGTLACAVAPTLWVLALGMALIGAGHAGVHVSRQAQLDLMVPLKARARGLTTLAGVWRIGNFIGPLIGAALIHAFDLSAGYYLGLGMVTLGAIAYAINAPSHLTVPRRDRVKVKMWTVLRPHRKVLSTLGLGIALLGAARQVRVVVIPLWAEQAGLTASQTSLIFGLATALDMAMFLPAGWVMDKVGRRWTAVPSAMALAAGTAALPFTHSPVTVAAASLLIGLGHGWGSGVVMTLGADAAPEDGRAVFLGAWTNLQDIGGLLGPIVVAGGAAISVAAGVWAASGLGAGAAGALWRWTPPRAAQATTGS